MRVVVTGGCGFIGSNFVRYVLENRTDADLVVYDALTYAGHLGNLWDVIGNPQMRFVKGDIAEHSAVSQAVKGADVIVNFAAESHVDRSIQDAAPFIRTNITGTQVLLEVAREAAVGRFIQVSTDEVYGSLGPHGCFTESTPLAPNSPYSASKAAADLLVRAAVHTHGLAAVILRSSNAYGPYQFPEKLIPLMITNALEAQPLPVYGDGLHVRDWVHVQDLCAAILTVLEGGRSGEVYNVGGGSEIKNLAVVRSIVSMCGASEGLIRFVEDRPGHDRRYAMDYGKISSELGWTPATHFEDGLADAVEWYRANGSWVESVRSGEYRKYYERQYADRLARAR